MACIYLYNNVTSFWASRTLPSAILGQTSRRGILMTPLQILSNWILCLSFCNQIVPEVLKALRNSIPQAAQSL